MNLFALNKEDHEVKKMLADIKVDNVAFLMETRDSTYMSCTCGFCDNLILRSWRTSSKYENQRELSDGTKEYFCPNCETTAVYSIDDDECSFVLKYIPEVLNDDENSLDVKIKQVLGERDGALLGYFKEDSALLVRYFKKEKRFAFYNIDADGTLDDLEEWDEYEKLSDCFGYRSSFSCDYQGYPQNNKFVGFFDIVDIFRPYIPNINQWKQYDEIDLILLFGDMYMANESKLYSYIRDQKIDHGKWTTLKYNKFELHAGDINVCKANIKFLEENGIDKNAESLEAATGFTEEELLTTDGYRDLINTKNFYDKIKEYGLVEYLQELKITFNSEQRITFMNAFKLSKCESFGDFVKFICRGIRNENLEVNEVLKMVKEMIIYNNNEDIARLLNYKKAFSLNLYKKFMLLRDEIISFDMLEKLQKKPTIDTLIKLIEAENSLV
jgi:hypothetical protein